MRTSPRPGRLRPRDVLRLGGYGLAARPLRVVLSALGIAIGIAAMLAVVGISTSSRAELDRLLDALGTNLLTAGPGQTLFGESATLPDESIAMIGRIGQVESVTAIGQLPEAKVYRTDRIPAPHAAKTAGRQTDMSHYPPEKIAFAMRTPTWCRTRAEQIGPNAVAVIAELLAVNALFRLRAAQGVLRLADKHGTDRLETACGKAVTVGDPSYRTIKGILAAGVETEPPPPPAGDGGAAAFLHGPAQLFANVLALPTPDRPTAQAGDTANADSVTGPSDPGVDDEPGQADEGVSA